MAKARGRPRTKKVKTTEEMVDEKINAALTPIAALLQQLLEKKEEAKPKVKEQRVADNDDDDEDDLTLPLHKRAAKKNQKFPNKYVDNQTIAKEEIYNPKDFAPPQPRFGYQPIKVKCRVCNNKFLVDPGEAQLGAGENKMSYACDSCSSK